MYRAHRQAFRDEAIRLGLSSRHADAFTRMAATHHRLAEDSCNGVPWDRGQEPRHWAKKCGEPMACGDDSEGIKATYKISRVTCPDCKSCRIEDRARALAAETGVQVEFQGDPRGWTMSLKRLDAAKSA